MHLTQGAIGNLINRYRAVLRKCRLLNTFGSLAVASLLVMGPCAAAYAAPAPVPWTQKTVTIDSSNPQTVDKLYDTINPNTTNNILTETLTLLDGGSLTIAAGAKLNHSADAEQGFAGLTFDMQGGTFTSEGHVSAEAFTLSGGIASLANPGASTTSQGLWASSITIRSSPRLSGPFSIRSPTSTRISSGV